LSDQPGQRDQLAQRELLVQLGLKGHRVQLGLKGLLEQRDQLAPKEYKVQLALPERLAPMAQMGLMVHPLTFNTAEASSSGSM
jgi:hypothetical protein